jgi:putative nucleotidyltransferase with HDIG domain
VYTCTEGVLPARLTVVPPFPPIATRLLCCLAREQVEISELADLIASDAMFSGRVLQYANSAEFALREPVRNIRQALMTLGLDRTRRITVTASTAAYTKAALRTKELKRCWQHTLATAVLAEEISRKCGAFVDFAYAAGIMHDIGRLGLLVAYPDEYERTIRDAADRCLDLLDFEREIFGIDHAEAGRLLAIQWRLPEEFYVIAGRHHDPCEGSELSLLRIVHVACRLADALHYDVSRPLVAQTIDQVVEELPEYVRRRIVASAVELRARVEHTIRAFDGEEEIEDAQAARAAVRVEETDEEPSTGEAGMQAGNAGFTASLYRLFLWLYRSIWPD